MKMRMPRTKAARAAPTRPLTCLAAHLPNAADPPAALTRATIKPRITRNMNMPALPEMAGTKPSFIIVSTVPMGLKPVASSAPTRMPMNSEL